ncbi:hypothetical protein [Roseibium sp.]|uniref:hypothetical protein n=1 Tax=Roseibium sp. TaxID=1936156 RepID=UPI003A972CF6
MARTGSQAETLGVAEEALRSRAMPFVMIEIHRPLTLKEGQRLQLAARTGSSIGLCILPEGMGSNSAETRWRVIPVFDRQREDSTLMRWEIIKNKTGTLGAWNVQWEPKTRHLHVVSSPGK